MRGEILQRSGDDEGVGCEGENELILYTRRAGWMSISVLNIRNRILVYQEAISAHGHDSV